MNITTTSAMITHSIKVPFLSDHSRNPLYFMLENDLLKNPELSIPPFEKGG
jgi:hypothetical protein